MGRGERQDAAPQRRRGGEDPAEEAKRRLVKAWSKILPFGAQVVASAAAYTVGVTATQLVGFACKVSCATPVLGPCMGLLGVGLANAMAGQASRHANKLVKTGGNPLRRDWWEPADLDDVLLDALLGVCIFKALGGRFRSLMPSDLARPGALAFESIPARADHSDAYAKPSVKRELARIFRRDGCHHCGSRRGPVIGDHMPPNKLAFAKGGKDKLGQMVAELPGVAKVRELVGLAARGGRPFQRFYPQCQRCSFKQATALRNGKRVLVLHLHAPRYRAEHLAGVFVGIRHNVPPVGFPPNGADPRSRRSIARWMPLALTAAAPPAGEAEAEEDRGSAGRPQARQETGSRGQPQLLVQELSPGWSLGFPPAGAPALGQPPHAHAHATAHVHVQGEPYGHVGGKQQLAAGPPPVLRGSMGLVQQQLGDVLQQQDREAAEGMPPLLTPGHAKQSAAAAFERHFASGLAV